MNGWGASVYGDPCRECGFRWTTTLDQARKAVGEIPAVYGGLLDGASGDERHPGLEWSVREYVCHVADNLRIWAERLMGVVGGATAAVGGYDEHRLSEARGYRGIALPAARWSLGRSVDDWLDAVARSDEEGVVLVHPERGALTLADVAVSNAHDAEHHRWDLVRSLGR